MLQFIKQEWKYLCGLLVVIVALSVVYHEYKHYQASQTNQAPSPPANVVINTAGQPGSAAEPQVVYVQGQSSNTREIVYVPKDVDPQTGQQEKTDVQFDNKQGKVYVKVNGKEYEVPSTVQEGAQFENGKLVVTEQTEMHVDITAPKPSFNLGVGKSNNGLALEINGPLYKNVSWWVYGDRKTIGGGLQFPIMK